MFEWRAGRGRLLFPLLQLHGEDDAVFTGTAGSARRTLSWQQDWQLVVDCMVVVALLALPLPETMSQDRDRDRETCEPSPTQDRESETREPSLTYSHL